MLPVRLFAGAVPPVQFPPVNQVEFAAVGDHVIAVCAWTVGATRRAIEKAAVERMKLMERFFMVEPLEVQDCHPKNAKRNKNALSYS
jgi:hypothetical protein